MKEEIENKASDFATLTIRIAPSDVGSKSVPEGLLVNNSGEAIKMSIFLPNNGEEFLDPIKKKRFLYFRS